MIDGRIPEPARVTRQRTAVLDALRRAPEPLSAKDLHAGLGRSVGLATVYRALQGLVDAGRVDVFRRGAVPPLQSRAPSPSGLPPLRPVVEIDACGIELWASR